MARAIFGQELAKNKGFTLIEMVVVLAILAIIVSIALPNYQDYLKRSRRSDAMIALERIANEQEQFYFDWNTYTDSFEDLDMSSLSPEGFYRLSIETANDTLFIARAIPVAGSSQLGDGGFERHSTGKEGWDRDGDGIYECDWQDAARAGGGC
ncbi:MAG: type IV pilin protein [Arenicellales bacterium]|nr:type IV pilin protein [Arenicellales bacterium]